MIYKHYETKEIEVEIDTNDVLDQVGADGVCQYFQAEALLKHIDINEVIAYYGLEEFKERIHNTEMKELLDDEIPF